MTLEELLARESIRDAMATYNTAGDRLRWDDFVSVFTEDALFESDTFRHVGRDAIKAHFENWGGTSSAQGRRPSFVRHNLTTSKIELTGPDTAKARTYWFVMSDAGPDHAGVYVDEFRKTGERWLISRRQIRLDWRSADSLFAATPAR